MGRPRKDARCINVQMCISNEVNELVERYQAELRLKKGLKLRKEEAASQLFEKLAVDSGMIEIS